MSTTKTPSAIDEAIAAQRRILDVEELDPAADALAEIDRLEAERDRLTAVDAERATEQAQLADRWRPLQRELATVVVRAVAITEEMAELNERDLTLSRLRAEATDEPAVARYQLRVLECQHGGPLDLRTLRFLAEQVEALELDR
jgi:hypothetical protein